MPTHGLLNDRVLDTATATFLTAMQGYLPNLLIWGIAILSAVVFAGLGYALLMAALNHDWFGMLMGMGFAFVRVLLIYMLYENFATLGDMFPQMGRIVGQSVAGISPDVTTPSSFYSLGLGIIDMLFRARHFGAWFDLIADLEFVITIILTIVAWFGAAAVFMFTLVEVEWYFIKGAVTVCFAAFPNTFNTLENWAVQMLRTGIRFIAVLLIVAIGLLLAYGWTTGLAALGVTINTNQVAYGATQMVEAWMLFWAVWALPRKADNIVVSGGSGGSGLEHEPGKHFHQAVTGGIATAGRAVVSPQAALRGR